MKKGVLNVYSAANLWRNMNCDRHCGDIVHSTHHNMIISHFLKIAYAWEMFSSFLCHLCIKKPINVHHALTVSMHVNILWRLFLDQCFQCPSARPISWFIHIQNSVPCCPWRESDVACFHCKETKAGGHEDTSVNWGFSYQEQLFWYSISFLIARMSLFKNSPRKETNTTTSSTAICYFR